MFQKDFNDFYIKRRFSSIYEPYPLKIDYFYVFYDAKNIVVDIKENEMLLIPAGWFHFVLSENVDIVDKLNVAISYFTIYKGCPDCDISVKQIYTDNLINTFVCFCVFVWCTALYVCINEQFCTSTYYGICAVIC